MPRVVGQLTPLRPTNPSYRMELAIGLPLRNPAELATLLHDLYDPTSPRYRHFLTPEQFTDQFGPTAGDYQQVVDFARARGLTVSAVHPNRLVIDVEGEVPVVEQALHVTMHDYVHPRENRIFYAPDTDPALDLSVPVQHITGLDNYALPHPNLIVKPLGLASTNQPQSGSGSNGTYAGGDFRAAYVPGTTLTGTGQSIGLLEFDGYYASDITAYENQFGITPVPLTKVSVDGGIRNPGSNTDEVSLDIEMAACMAPGASAIYVYEAPSTNRAWDDMLSRMASDNKAKQLSCSWTGGGPDSTAENIFMEMATQGQSFFTASGDSDAYTGSISFPADSPYITVVGGTTLATSGPDGTYQAETVWNWGYDNLASSYVGSSGGVSTTYSIPSYQQPVSMASNQGSTSMRNIPDVALTADNIYITYGNGSTGTVGGTSAAAPLWAAFMALVNQQAAANGMSPLGFLNPSLYSIGTGTSASSNFHDITSGNNFSSSSPSKYSAVAGYDLCTGWGTPGGMTLVNTLAGTPAAVASSDGPAMPPMVLALFGVLLFLVAARYLRPVAGNR